MAPEPKKKEINSRDDEEKDWNFPHLDKILAELNPDRCSIGSILASMVYQID